MYCVLYNLGARSRCSDVAIATSSMLSSVVESSPVRGQAKVSFDGGKAASLHETLG